MQKPATELQFTDLLAGRSSVAGAKCDGARTLKSRAERSKEHRAFHADRQDDVAVCAGTGGDGERSIVTTLGDVDVAMVGSTSGLELDGDVTAGDSKDL